MPDLVELPAIDSLWHFPAWTNPAWAGPWRVVKVGASTCMEELISDDGLSVFLEHVGGEPEGQRGPRQVPITASTGFGWPCGWEPWPEGPDTPAELLEE